MKLFLRCLGCYICLAIIFILLLPFLLVALYIIRNRKLTQYLGKVWAQIIFILVERFVGLTYHLDGFEQIQKSEVPMIIASKHQSVWETGALHIALGEQSVFIIKKELKQLPIFGQLVTLMGAIAIDRKKPVQAIKHMLDEARNEVKKNRSHIIIFPEGRRTAVGEKTDYTDGVYLLYKKLDLPVAAIALNSGIYWPKRHFLKYPGRIEAKVMEIIPPGLDRDQFRDRLVTAIENGSLELIQSHLYNNFPSPYQDSMKSDHSLMVQ